MYKTITLLPLLLFSFLHLGAATAIPNDDDDDDRHTCLTDSQAHTILYKWISFFEKIDPKVAERTLTKDFQLISSSTNFIEGKPSDAITEPNRAQFIADQTAATATGTEIFTVLNTIHTCDVIVFHWVDNSAPIPLTGFDYLVLKPGSLKLQKAYSEFNNAAVLYNAKLFPCPA